MFLVTKGNYFKADSTATVYYKGKEKLKGDKCYKIEIVFPRETDEDLGLSTQYTKTIYINKKTKQPQKLINSFDMDGLTQYSEVTLTNFTTYSNKESIEKRINDSLISLANSYSEYVPETVQDTTQIEIDTTEIINVTNFKTKQLDGDIIQLSKLDKKLIILDFWYVSCAPCLASIPFLNDLYNRYKGKDLAFYSVNAYDDEDRINKIKELKGIEYPILLGKEIEIDKLYNIRSFPTLLILDEELNILHKERGFGLGMEEEVYSIIDKLLEN